LRRPGLLSVEAPAAPQTLTRTTWIEMPELLLAQLNPDPHMPLNSAILALYEAITDENHWRTVLQRLCGHVGGNGIAVLPCDGGAAAAIAAGIPASDLDALCGWLSTQAPGAAQRQSDDPVPSARRWLMPRDVVLEGLSGHHLLVRLDQDACAVGYADLYRARSECDFDEAATQSFLALAPYLAQALAVAMRLSAAETCARRCAQCRDLRSFGCLVLDDAGSIMEMNGTARDWLEEGDGLRVTDERLHAQLARDEQAIEDRLREVLADEVPCGAVFVDVSRPSGRRPYVLFMSRIDSPLSAFGVRVPRVRLLIVDADRGNDVPREVLQAMYGLTRTEREVAWHLANGASLEEAAQRLGIAHNTARHHLERIFAKTGARRQSDLVRLALAPFVSLGSVK
jgi:DNA-binding CsgD family transcriptional regulator